MSAVWEIKRRLCEAVNAHDLCRAIECYAPDAVLVSPVGVAEGLDQIAWFYEQLLKTFPDFHQLAWYEADCDDPAITEWTITGTQTGPLLMPDGRVMDGTGRPIIVRAACAAHADGDKIITHREYYDQLELYSQLGFSLFGPESPPPPPPDPVPPPDTAAANGAVEPAGPSGWRQRLLRAWQSPTSEDDSVR